MGSERAASLESVACWNVFAFGERTLTCWPCSNQMVPYNSTGPPWSCTNSLAVGKATKNADIVKIEKTIFSGLHHKPARVSQKKYKYNLIWSPAA